MAPALQVGAVARQLVAEAGAGRASDEVAWRSQKRAAGAVAAAATAPAAMVDKQVSARRCELTGLLQMLSAAAATALVVVVVVVAVVWWWRWW